VHAAGDGVFLLLAVVGGDVDATLALGDLAEADDAIDFGDDGGFARLAGFEELDDAGRPPVMSLVRVVSRGILARMSPGETSSPSWIMR